MLSDLFYTFVYLNLVTVLMFIIMRKKSASGMKN